MHIVADKICGTERDDCSENARCTDTAPGEYTCTCNEGYIGDGRTCKGLYYNYHLLNIFNQH